MVGGVHQPGLDGGGTPVRSGWWGVPQPGLGREYPGQVWMVRGTPARSGWWGEPQPGLDGGGYPGYPPSQVWMEYPPSHHDWMGYPRPGLGIVGGKTPSHLHIWREWSCEVTFGGCWWMVEWAHQHTFKMRYPRP